MSNSEMVAGWVRAQERRGLRPRSIRRRTDVVRHFDRWFGRPFAAAGRQDVEAWLDEVPRTSRTRFSYLSALHGFYLWMDDEHGPVADPTARIPRPKVHPGLPRPIGRADLLRAVTEAAPMMRAWLLLGALGGLRCQEIAGIHRQHVWDHEDPALLHVVDGKGGRERVVPLHHDTLAALHAHGMPRFGPLFRSPHTGRPYSGERLSQVGNGFLRSVGVDATMHQLRHRFGTDFYRASRDLRLTQSVLGHSSPVTTAIYTAWSPADAAAVVFSLDVRAAVSSTVPAHARQGRGGWVTR